MNCFEYLLRRGNFSPPANVAFVTTALMLVVFTTYSQAKIVYTPVNTTLAGSGHIKIDLNHDGIKDFDIQSAVSELACGTGHGIHGVVTVKPTTGDGVIASGQDAVALAGGIRVNSTGTFSNIQSLMTNRLFSRGCGPSYFYGQYGTGYLGLRFVKDGQRHYGWAYVSVTGSILDGFSVNLKGFAYETIAGRGITTGQTSG
jgi:hypothetical protein